MFVLGLKCRVGHFVDKSQPSNESAQLCFQGPKMSVRTMSMIARLTDPNNFTGIHKHGENGTRRDVESGSSSSGQSFRAVSPSKLARSHQSVVSSRPVRQADHPGISRPPVSANRLAAGHKSLQGANSVSKDSEKRKSGKKQRPASPDHRPKSHTPYD